MAKNWFLETGSAYGLSIESRYSNYASRLSLEDNEISDEIVIASAIEVSEAQNDVDNASDNIDKAEEALEEVEKSNEIITEVLENNQEVTAQVAQEALYKVNEKLGAVRQFTKCRPARMPSFESISTSPMRSLELAHEGISEMWKALVEFIKKMWGKIKEFFSNLWKKIRNFFAGLKPKLEKLKEQIKKIKDGTERDEKFDKDAIEKIMDNDRGMYLSMVRNGKPSAFIDITKDSIKGFKDSFKDIAEQEKTVASTYDKFLRFENNSKKEPTKDPKTIADHLKGTDQEKRIRDIEDSSGASLKRAINNLNKMFDKPVDKSAIELAEISEAGEDAKIYFVFFSSKKLYCAFKNGETSEDTKSATKAINFKEITVENYNKYEIIFPNTITSSFKDNIVKTINSCISFMGDAITAGDMVNDIEKRFDGLHVLGSGLSASADTRLDQKRQSELIKFIKDTKMLMAGYTKDILWCFSKGSTDIIPSHIKYFQHIVSHYKSKEDK